MGAVTYCVAMPFVRNEHGELEPGETQKRMSASASERDARRMAETAQGLLLSRGQAIPATSEFDDALCLDDLEARQHSMNFAEGDGQPISFVVLSPQGPYDKELS